MYVRVRVLMYRHCPTGSNYEVVSQISKDSDFNCKDYLIVISIVIIASLFIFKTFNSPYWKLVHGMNILDTL